MQAQNNKHEILGEVTVPSGTVVLIDFGLMDLWTHNNPPLIKPGILPEEALESANKGADFIIEGPDAESAGAKFARQPNPFYIYDIPRHGVAELEENFASFVKSSGLNARLRELTERVPPRQRIDQTLEHGAGAGEIFLHGIHSIAVGNLPKDRVLTVTGERMNLEEYADHWRSVSLLLRADFEESKICRSKQIGCVAVDMARLMFCDADAMGKWIHEDSIDGLADFVFWGKDALRLSKKFEAPHVQDNIYGFVGKPVMELAETAMLVKEHLDLHHLVAALDFRPHSDHWRMLKTISEHKTESGTIDLADSKCCGFMTSWGDGFFPVYLDLDADGRALRLKIELGTEETLNGMRMVNRFA